MTFPIEPHDILSLTEDSVVALAAAPGSVRRAYVCVIMAAHMADHVAAAKGFDLQDYRERVEQRQPELKLVRDLGNYAKHVHITRYSPQAERITAAADLYSDQFLDEDSADYDDWPEHESFEGFYVRDSSSHVQSLLSLMRTVVFFWREELLLQGLTP